MSRSAWVIHMSAVTLAQMTRNAPSVVRRIYRPMDPIDLRVPARDEASVRRTPYARRSAPMLIEALFYPVFDPATVSVETITVDEAAHRLDICVGSVKRLIHEGTLPATQLMRSAPWQIPVSALDTEAVRIGVRAIKERRPSNFKVLQDLKTLTLPGF